MHQLFPTSVLRAGAAPDREELDKLLARAADGRPLPQGEARDSWEEALEELDDAWEE